tara:strand:- start:1934 stop:3010 length:1077 start_codon:yes stop_codon:yes gene_type:complete
MKKLILYNEHVVLGGKMIDFAGYMMPVQYTDGVLKEHNTVRNMVGVFDVSHMGEIFISGKKSLDFLQYITSNNVEVLEPGQVQYTYLPNTDNGIVDDLLLYKLNENRYLLVVNAANIEKDIAWLNKHNTFDCIIDNQSENYSLLAVQGPKSVDLLQELTDVDLSKIKYYNFQIDTISGVDDVIISRTGYTGELGFELYVRNNHVKVVWNSLFATSIKIKPIGLAARDTLRLEKGFCLYGNDIDDYTSPIEAGLGWVTKYKSKFINPLLLDFKKQSILQKKLVGLQLIEKGIPRNGYQVCNSNGEEIGIVTSGSLSPTLSLAIAMAYITIEYTKVETQVFVKIRHKLVESKIVSLPFFN